MDVIKVADYIIDLGPDGGSGGGKIVATGTPEEVAKVKGSYTGEFLAKILKKSQSYISREIKSLVYKLEKLMYQNATIERPKIKNKCIGYNKKNVL